MDIISLAALTIRSLSRRRSVFLSWVCMKIFFKLILLF